MKSWKSIKKLDLSTCIRVMEYFEICLMIMDIIGIVKKLRRTANE